jgi:hypothetical protein
MFKDATLFFSRGGTPNIASVIPVMDHLDEHMVSATVSEKYDPAIRAAVAIRKKTLNRYYDQTDHSELYRIAMGMCPPFVYLWESANSVYSVLHPRHKLTYFQRAGWTADWIMTAKTIVHEEYDCTYHFREDVTPALGPTDANEATMSTNLFDNLPAFCSLTFGTVDELTHYLTTPPEDVKNEDILTWWFEHKHVYPHLY